MSRIGKKKIEIPAGVTVQIKDQNILVKGSKGELFLDLDASITVEINEADKELSVGVKDEAVNSAIWGTTRANIANMILGVTQGWSKSLELNGVGFKMDLKANKLVMRLGFSHEIEYELPSEIEAEIEKNILRISGISRQLVGQVAAEIRSFKKPEPYKGKGFRYIDEIVRRKAGKTSKTE